MSCFIDNPSVYEKPNDSAYFSINFADGPLGITLHRHGTFLYIYVKEIVPGSQAEGTDVVPGDRIWALNDNVIGNTKVEKDEWSAALKYIKESKRPLKITFRRVLTEEVSQASSQKPPPTSVNQSVPLPSAVVDSTQARAASGETTQMRILKNLASQLVVKDLKNRQVPAGFLENLSSLNQNAIPSEAVINFIVRPNRRLLRCGELDVYYSNPNQNVSTAGGALGSLSSLISGLGMTSNKRCVHLLNDLIIVSVEKTSGNGSEINYQVELMLDLATCKLRLGKFSNKAMLSSLVPNLSIDANSAQGTSKNQILEVISTGVTLVLVFRNRNERDVWYSAIYNCLKEWYFPSPNEKLEEESGLTRTSTVQSMKSTVDEVLSVPFGWQHQFQLGTMHSAVVARDEKRVAEILGLCDQGEYEYADVLDIVDDLGFTPLHYAVIFRLHSIVEMLHQYCSDVCIPDASKYEWTALHWAAVMLDFESLEPLRTHIFDMDIIIDSKGRSPLVLACLEGRTPVTGATDPYALARIIDILADEHTNVNEYVPGSCIQLTDSEEAARKSNNEVRLSQVTTESAMEECIYTLLHCLAGSWQHEPCSMLLKKGAKTALMDARCGCNALHIALSASSIKRAEGEGSRYLDLLFGRKRSKTDAEGLTREVSEPEPLEGDDFKMTLEYLLLFGARPNVRTFAPILNDGLTPLQMLAKNFDKWEKENFAEAVYILLSFGARLPPAVSVPANVEISSDYVLYAFSLIQSVCLSEHIEDSIKRWNDKPTLDGAKANITAGIYKDFYDISTELFDAMLVANAKSLPSMCSLCQSQFTFLKRSHKCRFCEATCCDDCSRKRITVDSSQLRSCDGCYNRAAHAIELDARKAMIATMKVTTRSSQSNGSGSSASAGTQEMFVAQKTALLGTANSSSAQQKPQSAGTAGAMAASSEAMQRLQERGEKLNQVNDKSAQLANASNDFAKLAKQLKDQSKSSWW